MASDNVEVGIDVDFDERLKEKKLRKCKSMDVFESGMKKVSNVISEIRTRNKLLFDGYSYSYVGGNDDKTKKSSRKMKKPKPISKKVNHGLCTPNGFVSTGPYYSGTRVNGLPVRPMSGWLLPALKESEYEKRTLVLDLDETLVHSSTSDFGGKYDFAIYVNTILNKAKIITAEEIKEKNIKNCLTKYVLYIKKRPGLGKFLRILSKSYELVVFTAGLQCYADVILNNIDMESMINHRLYRQHCTIYNGKYVKDLSRLGRPLCDVILVDNAIDSGFFQKDNHIIIKDFIDDEKDRELLRYVGLLEKIKEKKTIFPIIRKFNSFITSQHKL